MISHSPFKRNPAAKPIYKTAWRWPQTAELQQKKAGTAVITAYALNTVEYGYYGNYNEDPYAKAVKKEIKVNVRNTESTAELVGCNNMELSMNTSALLNVSSSDVLTYTSENEAIATVNSVGRVFAKSIGETNITVQAANGNSKTVKITVLAENADEIDHVKVGIFVLYNDSEHEYWDNEIGETVNIRSNGTYTLTYDISQHQSEMAKAAGIDTINNVTAIYLKDVEVHSGEVPKSAFRHCLLKWEKVEINGQEMKLSDDRTEYLSPINASGVFDSGKPVNAWDGNDIEGVSVSDHTAVFSNIEKPTSVTLTFTISQIMHRSAEVSQYVEAVLFKAADIDTSSLSQTEAKEFNENVEALRTLYNNENTSEEELISCYSKVKIVIDELTAATSETESGNGNAAVIIVCVSAAIVVAAAVFIIIRIFGRKKAKSNDRNE